VSEAGALSPEGLRARARALRAVRSWFDERGYLEVPTPALVCSPAMEEHLFALRAEGGFLRTSPEFALKRVVAAGLHRVYEIGPCFRGRERGDWHGTEFTMLEWYRVGAELVDLMDEVEELVAASAHALGVPSPRWRRTTVRQLFLDVTGIDLATASASELSDRDDAWDDAFFRRWIEEVEPTLTGAVFVEDWPASMSALARVRGDAQWPVACRFEAFLNGVELANAFLELTDVAEQRRRFTSSKVARMSAGEEPHPIDERFVEAVGRLPRTAGIALGFDRLVAALLGWDGIAPGRVG
jgi:lysyl-tRNA synthetase class 2